MSARRFTRIRLAGAIGLLFAALGAPALIADASGPISCATVSDGGPHWQKLKLPISNPTGFAVDYLQPNRLLVSSGTQIYLSSNHGCSWVNAVSLTALAEDAGYSSAISRIVDVAFNFRGNAIATVSEGVGSEARPHVIRSDNGAKGTWTTSDNGLPPVGEPRTLSTGLVGFVIGLAQLGSDTPIGGGGLPGGIGGGTDPTGQLPAMVYRSSDGQSWKPGATSEGFDGQRVISAIAADRFLATEVYAVAGGRLYRSVDGGQRFSRAGLSGTPTAIATTLRSEVAAFGTDFAARSTNSGASFRSQRTVPGARAAAWRIDGSFMVASQSRVYLTNGSTLDDVTPDKYVGGTPTLRSTFTGRESTWYLTAGSTLYRWFDTYKPAKQPPGIPNERVSFPPAKGSISPSPLQVDLRPNASRTVRYHLHLPKNATPIDVYYLIDVSHSMGDVIADLQKNAKSIGTDLKAQGIDVNEGVAAVGTVPNAEMGLPPDPPTNPSQCPPSGPKPPNCDPKPYHQPVLYKRWAPVGKVDNDFFRAVDSLSEEYYIGLQGRCGGSYPANGCDPHLEGQLVGLLQSLEGNGVQSPTLTVPVPPGQAAGFRQDDQTKRVIVLATDERFRITPGTPVKNNAPDIAGVAAKLKANGILVLGLSKGVAEAREDLLKVAKGTGAVAPPGGLDCAYGDYGRRIPAGQPIVCEDTRGFSTVIGKLLASLEDFQPVSLAASRKSPVLRSISVTGFPKVNVKNAFDADFSVTYSCAGLPTGSYPVAINAGLRGYTVATAIATVNCGSTPVAFPPKVELQPAAPQPPGQPAPPPPAPVPAQPVPQAQSQVQAQAQVNPQVGGAAQQEEQLQLALAQAGLYLPDDDDEKVTQLSMSRRDTERAAIAVLAAALASTSVGGLALMRRLRAQRAVRTRPVWASRG